jgi:hypothetical protein
VGAAGAAALLTAAVLSGPPATAAGTQTTTVIYDSFSKPGGYTLADYGAKWSNIYGPLEMANSDTRSFAGNAFHVSATPFTLGPDFSVFDHLKYIAISNAGFAVPTVGSVEISSTITASTPGTQTGRVVHGTYTASSQPWSAVAYEGQQAAAVMNVIDFSTGQLFDWFVSGSRVFTLVERLPTAVTRLPNADLPTTDPGYVGKDLMYTQIVREGPVSPGPHSVSIRYTRDAAGQGHADYYLDGARYSHVDHVGIPLDRQGASYTGTYPSLGPGQELGTRISSLSIGHGLFSLLDAFPFQHPEVPELAVSIPYSERVFGQGAAATFDDFKVKTVTQR